MPDLMDRLYCSEQIHIPPTFPFIMKLYCKAAIRTQPYDLLRWSAAYFRALANGEEPPVKDRIEYPPYDSPTGLTPGYIKMLIKQLGKDPGTTVTAQTLFIKWNSVCLEDELLVKLVALTGAKTTIKWLKFVGVAAGFISTSLTNTMILICELLTDEPEGGMAAIPLAVFNELYIYLANLECGPLTDEEKKQLEDKDWEEDASVIAEKIRTAVYEGEEEEGEFHLMIEEEGEREMEVEGETEFVMEDKETEEEEKTEFETAEDKAEVKGSEAGEGGSSEEESAGDAASKQSEGYDETRSREAVDDEASTKEPEASESRETASVEQEAVIKEEAYADVAEASKPSEKTVGEDRTEDKAEEDEKKPSRKIKLEDIEETIRMKIEEGLKEDEESGASREGFDELGSYLLDAAARVRAYTAEEIGYRIFKKYTRQEVPGIGPRIDKAEIEKVIDFMDYNSHKQQGMVMPRNIRHWMCPPLDKVPVPEP